MTSQGQMGFEIDVSFMTKVNPILEITAAVTGQDDGV